jgi:hypothetical protein
MTTNIEMQQKSNSQGRKLSIPREGTETESPALPNFSCSKPAYNFNNAKIKKFIGVK